jgi:8-oxo-dGTP diphosphatase
MTCQRSAAFTVVVTAAVIERDGRFLVTKRQRGVHLEGLWEFPGGKCEAGEDLRSCLLRELKEELGVAARIGDEILMTTHAYEDRRVELHFIGCELLGSPTPQIGQEMRWVPRAELAALQFPPADAELIRLLVNER